MDYNKYYFITSEFADEILNKVIRRIFPQLNDNHINLLWEYFTEIVDIIAIKFNVVSSQFEIYKRQFRQNDYRDCIGIIYMLLPYIDDDTGIKKLKLKSFDELYIKKKQPINNQSNDINSSEPKYEYTNLQYGRCIRQNEKLSKEIPFAVEHFKNNYVLLLDTIQTVANKLYVNWINIRPISYAGFKKSTLYTSTEIAFKNHKIQHYDLANEQGRWYSGLYIGDIYNIMSIKLYHDVKNVKWLIYDLDVDGYILAIIEALRTLLDLTECVNNVSWDSLSYDMQMKFSEQWKTMLRSTQTGQSIDKYNNNVLLYIIRALVRFFDLYYKYTNKAMLNNNYIALSQQNKDDLLDEDILIEVGEDYHIFVSGNSIAPEHIYEYIRDCLDKFKNTWYSKHYITKDKITGKYIITGEIEDVYVMENITPKNIYNYCKNIISYTDKDIGKYIQFPNHWQSLTIENKRIFMKRLNWNIESSDEKLTSWFSITRYLKKLKYENIELNNEKIFLNIISYIIPIIFEILTTNGMISEFVPDPKLTDNTIISNKQSYMYNLMSLMTNKENREKWDKSYYFLTGDLYENMDITDNDGNIIKYLDAIYKLPSTHSWIQNYAMDWISQIAFFHHYLNNRVIYITGSTGVGKSTQTPKLFMYALKTLSYKSNGSVACTQPRIPPTIQNAEFIAKQMGIPLYTYNTSIQTEVRTDNYYVQYKYKNNSHEMETNKLSLIMMTDGTLIQKLESSILKKRSFYNKQYSYKTENIYDIIMIDEAHEHNKNMDIILTQMLYAAYYNNDIKLVILSATMDDDEPIYRRYYRKINDNRMYPLNTYIQKYTLDRINVDRRMHISPPQQTTQYKINDIYIPDIYPDYDREGRIKEIIIDTIKNLISNTIGRDENNDILLFQPGRKEIMEYVKELNTVIANPSVIALPYFSELSQEKREFIDNIADKKKELTIPKDTEYASNYDINKIATVPKGTYKCVIIVATNIAEASITINTLKYVFETGVQKTAIFDYQIREANLKSTNISESSRIQRRGRVGRVGFGEVYYMYPKGTMEKNKKQFGISIDNLSDILLDLSQKDPNEKSLFDQFNDPNNFINKDIINITDIKEKYSNNIHKIIQQQYFINQTFYNYYGNNSQCDFYNDRSPYIRYESGFTKSTLDDTNGTFYIIHPEELSIKRNISGTIVNIAKDASLEGISILNNNIQSKKMETFWNINQEKLLIVHDYDNDQYYKTDYGKYMSNIIKETTDYDSRLLISYMFSRKYQCSEDMIKLLAMYLTIDNSVEKLFAGEQTPTGYKPYFPDKQPIYTNDYGDSYALLKIANMILDFINNNIVNLGSSKQIINADIKSNIIRSKQLFMEKIKTKSNDYKTIDLKILDKLIKMNGIGELKRTNDLDQDETINFLSDDTVNEFLYKKIEDNFPKIEEFCKSHKFNYITFRSFIKNYINMQIKFKKIENKQIKKDYDLDPSSVASFDWIDNNLIVYDFPTDNYEKIKSCLLNGYYFNIFKNINSSEYYINIYNPSIQYIYSVKAKKQKKYKSNEIITIYDTFLNQSYPSNMILSIVKDNENISIVERINMNDLKKININVHIDDDIIQKEYHENMINKFTESLIKYNFSIKNDYLITISDIHHIKQIYDNKNLDLLTYVDSRDEIKRLIYRQKFVVKYGGNSVDPRTFYNRNLLKTIRNK